MAHRFTQDHDFRMKSGLDEERTGDITSHGKDNAGKKVMPSGMATLTAVLVTTGVMIREGYFPHLGGPAFRHHRKWLREPAGRQHAGPSK